MSGDTTEPLRTKLGKVLADLVTVQVQIEQHKTRLHNLEQAADAIRARIVRALISHKVAPGEYEVEPTVGIRWSEGQVEVLMLKPRVQLKNVIVEG
jgi:hypothetical protein